MTFIADANVNSSPLGAPGASISVPMLCRSRREDPGLAEQFCALPIELRAAGSHTGGTFPWNQHPVDGKCTSWGKGSLIPLFTGFHTFRVLRDFWTINSSTRKWMVGWVGWQSFPFGFLLKPIFRGFCCSFQGRVYFRNITMTSTPFVSIKPGLDFFKLQFKTRYEQRINIEVLKICRLQIHQSFQAVNKKRLPETLGTNLQHE